MKEVPISHIKKFNPKNVNDFTASKVYSVWYCSEDDENDDGDYYRANVLLLGSKY